jgi:hypothetical protein
VQQLGFAAAKLIAVGNVATSYVVTVRAWLDVKFAIDLWKHCVPKEPLVPSDGKARASSGS